MLGQHSTYSYHRDVCKEASSQTLAQPKCQEGQVQSWGSNIALYLGKTQMKIEKKVLGLYIIFEINSRRALFLETLDR